MNQLQCDMSGQRFSAQPLPNLDQWAESLIDRENVLTDRAEILRAIAFHESRLLVLRQKLPIATKTFYRFRTSRDQFVWVYALNREQANQRLEARMNQNYGAGNWRINSTVVDVYDNPDTAALQVPDNLFRCLTLAEGRECLADYQATQRGRATAPKLKDVAKSRLELDAEAYEKFLRQLDK